MQSHVMHITHRKYIRYVHAHGVNSLRIQFSGRRHVKHIVSATWGMAATTNVYYIYVPFTLTSVVTVNGMSNFFHCAGEKKPKYGKIQRKSIA